MANPWKWPLGCRKLFWSPGAQADCGLSIVRVSPAQADDQHINALKEIAVTQPNLAEFSGAPPAELSSTRDSSVCYEVGIASCGLSSLTEQALASASTAGDLEYFSTAGPMAMWT